MTTACSKVRNQWLEPKVLPSPLAGVLKPGQIIILSLTPADLEALAPGINAAFDVQALPNTYAGPTDDAKYLSGKDTNLIPFTSATVAANLSASSAVLAGGASNLLNAVTAKPGFVTGVSGNLYQNAQGALQVDVYKNGAPFAADILGNTPRGTLANGSKDLSASFAAGRFPFAAGDELSVRLTTSSGWASTGGGFLGFLELAL